MKQLVSILIPAYNAEPWIADTMEVPRLSWKYAWMRPLFGWGLAKRTQMMLPLLKASFKRSWDRTIYNLEIASQRRLFRDTGAI
jgi:hypothetical protein